MRKNLLVIIAIIAMTAFFGCNQSSTDDNSGGGTEETQASIKFVREGGLVKIIMDLYVSKTTAGILIPHPGVDPSGTYDYTKFTPGTYYVGWSNGSTSSWPQHTFEKGKKYTATLNTAEDAVTVTLD